MWDHDIATAPRRNVDFLPASSSSTSTSVFDMVTRLAGTAFVLFATLVCLLIWAVLGIVLGPTQTWQIVIQNASSIQCYISDTLLMRQQQHNDRDLLILICQLRSRNETCRRRIEEKLTTHLRFDGASSSCPLTTDSAVDHCNNFEVDANDDAVRLPHHTQYDRVCDWFVLGLSTLVAWIIYWLGIFVWLGLLCLPVPRMG
jgi:low-affinity ferrous iron transport protein